MRKFQKQKFSDLNRRGHQIEKSVHSSIQISRSNGQKQEIEIKFAGEKRKNLKKSLKLFGIIYSFFHFFVVFPNQ